MSTLVRRVNPLSDMLDWLETETSMPLRGTAHYIRVEDYLEDGAYVVRAELPGMDPDKDVEISVEGDLLTIQGHRREESKDKYHSEFRYGSFTRTVRLPAGSRAEEVEATYGDGVLKVSIPMGEVAPSVTKVPVQRAPETTG
jgi:HSP20 family molecular chaperone IbpA